MSRLHVFDMDGTLLRDSTASLEIARRLDCLPDLVALEESFAAELVDTRAFAAELRRLWHALTPEVVADVFDQSPWIDGLDEVVRDIRARGERSLVITMSPDFYAGRLRTRGLDEVVASRFPALPFRAELDPAGILTPADKVTAVDQARRALGLGRDACVAYGDSGSDIPLFRELTHTVAVNASHSLRALARHHYDGDNLHAAYQLARSHMPVDQG